MQIFPLSNLGATCWLNSLLQSLIVLKHFPIEFTINRDQPQQLHFILYQIIFSNDRMQRMNHVAQLVRFLHPKFTVGMQHDVLEALLYIIEQCIEEENKLDVSQNNDISTQNESYQHWIKAQKMRLSKIYGQLYTQYFYFCKDGEQVYNTLCGIVLEDDTQDSQLRISSLMQNYFVKQNYQISRLSPIFILSLNNICKNYEKQLIIEDKLFIMDKTYELRSMIYHHGGLYGGHYNCVIKANNNEWILCDDDRIEPIQTNPNERLIPTLMFYEEIIG